MKIAILGISAFYHDSAAVLIVDGKIVAAAEEERFTRTKHDRSFPIQAIQYVLQEGGLSYQELTGIAFYEKPLLKFERLLETYHACVPRGLPGFIKAIPIWIKEKLFIRKLLRKHFMADGNIIPLYFPEHHLSHAASAFFPSPYEDAAILTIDGVGEWATLAICYGKSNQIRILKELHFPHSVGLLYSSFTYYLGFKVNSGEYKLMGLSAFGDPISPQTLEFKNKILSEMVDIREDGSILLNMSYFKFATGLKMTRSKKWERLFGFTARKPESALTQSHMNLALAIQEITETIVIELARTAKRITNSRNLVMAGGVALNCVANSRLAATGIFDHIWIQPSAGDAGGALGAAQAVYYLTYKAERKKESIADSMQGSYLGPRFSNSDIVKTIDRYEGSYEYFDQFNDLAKKVSQLIAAGNVIGWFQNRMEFGPRALGNRSILGDPRNPDMQKIINLKIKSREEFRPFAPSVLIEDVSCYFNTNQPSPYMLFVQSLKESRRKPEPVNYREMNLQERLYHARSDIPAVTHVDYSSRIQTVCRDMNHEFWQLIRAFKEITGCSMLINTSFNIRGEPIVCTPQDAFLGFMRTGMDFLVMGNYLLDKTTQKLLSFPGMPNISMSD